MPREIEDPRRIILEKDEWLRYEDQVRQERIVTVNQAMGVTPCLYFGTRRCTYSDVVSVVTTVKAIPRLGHQGCEHNPHNGAAAAGTTSPVVWTESTLYPSKDSYAREPALPVVYSGSEAAAYVNSPLEGDRDRKRRLHDRQALALTKEKQFFMAKLHESRRARYNSEQHAALVIQRLHRGYVLRKRFLEIKEKLKLRKRIRVNLVQVTKGTAIITGEKERRARILAVHHSAACKIQMQVRARSARKCVAKERTLRRHELLQHKSRVIQRTWRSCMAKASTRKVRERLLEQRQRTLAILLTRLFQGYAARQRVRRIRMHREVLAAQRIQWFAQAHHARKAQRLQHRRQRQEIQQQAAIQVQKIVRGHLCRAKVLCMRVDEEHSIRTACALAIQRVFRGYVGRQRMHFQRVFHIHQRAWRGAMHITRIVRGFLARQAVKLEKVLQETDILIQTRRGNISTVIDLLDGYGIADDEPPADVTSVNPATNNSIVHLAAKHGHFDIITHVVPKLLASSAPSLLYATNRSAESPLELAIRHGHEKIAAYLLATTSALFETASPTQVHRKVHPKSGRERTLLHEAARHGMGTVLTKLLLLFPQIFTGKEVDSWTKRTVLHEALLLSAPKKYETPRETRDRQEQVLATMTTILTKVPQVKIDAQDFLGFTVLHLAAQLGNLHAVTRLLEYGADVRVADAQGRTAWRIALLAGNESCFLEIRRKWLDSVSSLHAQTTLDAQGSSPSESEWDDDRDDDGSSTALIHSATRANRVQQLHPQLGVELVRACKAGDLERIKFYIGECHVSANTTDDAAHGGDGASLLMLACQSGAIPVVKYLLQQDNLAIHYVNDAGKSALECALANPMILDLLVTESSNGGANPCHPFGPKKRSACHEAARRGFHIRSWLNRSAVIAPGMLLAMTDDEGRTPLHDAAAFAHVATASTLVNIGLRVDQPDENDRRTPLHDACRAGNAAIVKKMLQVGAAATTAMAMHDRDGRTPFFDAVLSGSVQCVALLLDGTRGEEEKHMRDDDTIAATQRQALLDQVDLTGCGLLHEAVGNASADGEDNEMIEFLISKSFPVATGLLLPDKQQLPKLQFPPKMLSPLHVASAAGNVFAVKRLLTACEDMRDARDSEGELPIHHAAKYGQLAVIETFAQFGVDINREDSETGSLLLHFAVQCAACDHAATASHSTTATPYTASTLVVETLIRKGNSVAAFNTNGLQPLHIAAACPLNRQHAVLQVVRALVATHNAPIDALTRTKAPATPIQIALAHDIWQCADILSKGYEDAAWQNEGYYNDVERFMTPDLATLMSTRRKLKDTFCAEWLRCCSTVSVGWLLDKRGTAYNLARAPIARGTTTLQQLVRWDWVNRGRVRFEYVPGYDTATAPSLRSFQRLCFALLYNFPQLLYRPHREHVLRPYSSEVQQQHEWHLEGVDTLSHYDASLLTSTHKV